MTVPNADQVLEDLKADLERSLVPLITEGPAALATTQALIIDQVQRAYPELAANPGIIFEFEQTGDVLTCNIRIPAEVITVDIVVAR